MSTNVRPIIDRVNIKVTDPSGKIRAFVSSRQPRAIVAKVPGPQGIKGDKGEKGDAGEISVGTVVAVNPDQSPSVTNSGTSFDAVLDFSLPRASTFSVGTVVAVEQGLESVTNVGTNGDVILDFSLPKGDQGEQGIQGIQGEKGDTGDTGPAGIVQSETSPADTNALWLDLTETGNGYSVYMEQILDVDYGSAIEPNVGDVLVWDGYKWVPTEATAVFA